jgi:hypothetical protein
MDITKQDHCENCKKLLDIYCDLCSDCFSAIYALPDQNKKTIIYREFLKKYQQSIQSSNNLLKWIKNESL